MFMEWLLLAKVMALFNGGDSLVLESGALLVLAVWSL